MKTLVLYHSLQSKFDAKHKEFDQLAEATAFVASKVKAGIICHLYNYDSSYQLESQITKTIKV